MPIKHLELHNVGPFAGERHFDLPIVCIINGGNGVGKTGLQEAIKYIGERGHDPDMIHGNAECGEIILTMSDDYQMRAYITRQQTTRSWKPPDGRRWIPNRAYIDEICTALAYDPLRFLDAKEADQAAELLRLAPLPPCPKEILAALAGAPVNGVDLQSTNPLEAIDGLYKATYEQRTQLNVAADSLEKHAAELERALPREAVGGWPNKLATLRKTRATEERVQSEQIAAINDKFQKAKADYEQARANLYLKAEQDYNSALRQIEQVRAAAKEAADASCAFDIEAARKIGMREADEVRAQHKSVLDAFTSDIAGAELLAQQEQAAVGTRESMERARTEAANKRREWGVLNTAIDNLRALRLKLAEHLPIKGVMVREGRIVREQDGGMVPLKKWNTAEQIKFALKIGMMVGGKAGFVTLDGFEAFDKKQRQAILATCQKYAEDNGTQFLLASVDIDAGPLRVTDAGK